MAKNLDFLEKEVNPLFEHNGTKVVTFDDYMAQAQSDLTKGYDLGLRTTNADGSFASTRTQYAAVNEDSLFLNAYRVKNGKVWLATAYPADAETYRALRERETGRVHTTRITVYVLARPKDGELLIDRKATVSADEFVAEFNEKLTNDAMKMIAPLIDKYTNASVATEIPI